MFGVVLATMMIPLASMIIPLFMVVKSLGWVDSYLGADHPGRHQRLRHLLDAPAHDHDPGRPARRRPARRQQRAADLFRHRPADEQDRALVAGDLHLHVELGQFLLAAARRDRRAATARCRSGIALFESSYGTNYPQLMAVAFAGDVAGADRLPGAPTQLHRSADDVGRQGVIGGTDASARTVPAGAATRSRGGLVVSCQAREDNPLHGPVFMAAMAKRRLTGGAVGIRADGVDDIAAIRAAIGPDIPIMGISKVKSPDGSSLHHADRRTSAREIIAAGAESCRPRGTTRPRPGGESLARGRRCDSRGWWGGPCRLSARSKTPATADRGGVIAVGTTLERLYAGQSRRAKDPISRCSKQTGPPICQCRSSPKGDIWTREDARRALDLGASFVVVGTAITNPPAITARFVAVMHSRSRGPPCPHWASGSIDRKGRHGGLHLRDTRFRRKGNNR